MRILITGGSGLLGQYLNMELSKENEILTTYLTDPGNCKNCNSVQLDIRDKENVINLFKNFKPEIVVHLAAISTPMPVPSLSSKKIYDINVNSTSTLAELCNNYSAKLIFISTDLVYAGYRGSMLKEDSKLIPISLYAETKLMGELKIQEISSNYIILRTSFLYGFGIENKKNHFDQMYNNLKNGK
ncbi:MAG TPA: sugar nucleotide-binding protein [Ignavibacteriaceae bacterium]|nr:sugar nucleotide-binding protein [Ignavibacteriaceae bacterium]